MAEKSISRKILIALDESENSEFAFKFYLNDISMPNDEVIFLHIFNPPAPPAFSAKNDNNEQWIKWRIRVEKKIKKRKELLFRFQTICDQNKLKHRAVLHSGSPGEGICEIAEQNDVTLILMGSRGLNKLRRTFLGSVSDYVAQHSSRSFIVVPYPKSL
ncbi:universal stress protein Slr1101 isoform X2 [Hydra vulgaris]|uniref:universal stress protein Slr1101 isoform X2 n=1 Tax=Hydra vulgaris TaxID=6087 RepID=UPI0032EA29F2